LELLWLSRAPYLDSATIAYIGGCWPEALVIREAQLFGLTAELSELALDAPSFPLFGSQGISLRRPDHPLVPDLQWLVGVSRGFWQGIFTSCLLLRSSPKPGLTLTQLLGT